MTRGEQGSEAVHSYEEKPFFGEVLCDGNPIEELIEPHPGQQMQAGVEEAEQAGRAARLDELGDAGEAAQRSDGETGQQKIDRPATARVGDFLHRVEAQRLGLKYAANGSRPRRKRSAR